MPDWTSRIRQAHPPTATEIVQTTIAGVVATVVGTIVAATMEGGAERPTAIMFAGATGIATFAVVDRVLTGRLPPIYGRRVKYSIPNAIGLFTALMVTTAQNLSIAMLFPTAMTLILIGSIGSDYLWARAET